MIEYKFDKHGGFFAHLEADKLIAYAYPSSAYATQAKRNPQRVAAEMIVHERDLGTPAFRAANRQRWEERYTYLKAKMGAAPITIDEFLSDDAKNR